MNSSPAPDLKFLPTIYGVLYTISDTKSSEGLCSLVENEDHTRNSPDTFPCTKRRPIWRTRNEAEIREKFRSFVKESGPDECWEWTGRINIPIRGQNYGIMYCRRKLHYSHRLAYEFANGPIPGDLRILHSCDNPLCVNPAHLRTGTQGENMRDCAIKGRASRTPHRNLYSLEMVDEWRRRHRADPKENSCVKLANEFRVAMATMRRAVTGRHFRQLRAAQAIP